MKIMKQTIIITECPEQQGWNKNTELCMDVKTFLRGDVRMRTGRSYQGVLTRNSEERMTFVETSRQKKVKRNPHIYEGEHITVTRRDDGTLHPNFRPIRTGNGFNVERYALEVYLELLWALDGLVEKGNCK